MEITSAIGSFRIIDRAPGRTYFLLLCFFVEPFCFSEMTPNSVRRLTWDDFFSCDARTIQRPNNLQHLTGPIGVANRALSGAGFNGEIGFAVETNCSVD
jgi:hypothetical protein